MKKTVSAQGARHMYRQALDTNSYMEWIYDLIKEQATQGSTMVAITIPSNLRLPVEGCLGYLEYKVSEGSGLGHTDPNGRLPSYDYEDIVHLKIEWR